jgi:hypothetical protein
VDPPFSSKNFTEGGSSSGVGRISGFQRGFSSGESVTFFKEFLDDFLLTDLS